MMFLHNPTDSMRITRPFGYQVHPILRIKRGHNGVDIGGLIAGKEGDPLYAVADGAVIVSKVNGGGVHSGYGYYVVIQHDGFATLYGHTQGLIVKVGQKVKAGEIVAYMGNTGSSTGAHLHFGVVKGLYASMNWVDPILYLKEEEMTQDKFNEMLTNYLNEQAGKNPDKWSNEERKWAELNGLITGNKKGYKQYKLFCTREELVVLFYRFYKLIKKEV